MRHIYLLVIFLPVLVQAQVPKNVMRQNLFWVRYQNQLSISPKWLLQSEIDNRMFYGPMKQHHLILRTQGRYNLSEQVQLGGGITYALQSPQDPSSGSDLVVPELRGQQDITLRQSIGKVKLQHRYMLDERFIQRVQEQELQPGYNFTLRTRYRLQAEVPLTKRKIKDLSLVLHDEVMLNFGKTIRMNVFDQNRTYAGIKWGASPSLAFELGYMYLYQQRASGTDFISRDITRLSIYHKVNLKQDDK